MNLKKISVFISLLLRHRPEVIGLELDEHGWADTEQLIEGIRAAREPQFDRAALDTIVATDEKQRYSYSPDGRLIRANQGHSIPVDVELPAAQPPEFLWHGTGAKYVSSIDRMGLIPKSRLYVHLSGDYGTAVAVGRRHGSPVVYRVHSGEMARQGYIFYLSVNGVWLTDRVPAEFLEKQEQQ